MALQLRKQSGQRTATGSEQLLPTSPGNVPGGEWNLPQLLVRRLLSSIGNPPVTVVLWDGTEIPSPMEPPIAWVRIRDRRTLWKLCINPTFEFGEAYASGKLDFEGDLPKLMAVIFAAYHRPRGRSVSPRRPQPWRSRPRQNTLAGSRDNVHHHYDIGNDFYRLWLDSQMVYTCAYFAEQSMSLEEAQVAKMDHVCRKLRLQPRETVLEAGCGWGSLALRMARQYGVRVKAFNISRDQILYARDWARRENLSGQVEFVDDDWREMNEPCDAFVSVGMLEHVGVSNYRQLGSVIDRCLKRHGRGLIHSIGQNYPQPFNSWVERRIVPGAYPPALSEMMDIFEPYDFSLLDVENLRLHYARTLRCWLERYEGAGDQIRKMFDERFDRMWRLYLSGSIAGFESGALQLFQVVFARGQSNFVPWTRADLYSADSRQSASFSPMTGDANCEVV